MVISGMVGVQEFSCFSISVVNLIGWGKTNERRGNRGQQKGKCRGSIFSLGHIKLWAPRGLRRKVWINTFGVGLGDLTQEKHNMLR